MNIEVDVKNIDIENDIDTLVADKIPLEFREKKEYCGITWVRHTRNQLKELLIELNNGLNYNLNPIVYISFEKKEPMYCFINKKGELQIGCYEKHDNYDNDCDVYVSIPYFQWADY